MPAVLTEVERKVLAALIKLTKEDDTCAWNPYYPDLVLAAGDANEAYRACRALEEKGLVKANGRAGISLFTAPSYKASLAGIDLASGL